MSLQPSIARRRIAHKATTVLAILVAGVLTAPPVSAAISCAFDPAAASMTVELGDEGGAVSLSRMDDAIMLNGAVCDPAATVDATVTVTVRDTSRGHTSVTIDLSGGPFVSSTGRELRFDVALDTGEVDAVWILGGTGDDHVVVGTDGVNLNATSTVTVDLDATGVESWTLRGRGGNDQLSAAGGAGTGAPLATGVDLFGGPGADVLSGGVGDDTIDGGGGGDVATYSDRTEDLRLSLNAVADDGAPWEQDNIVNVIELIGGSGHDRLTGHGGVNILRGGAGHDVLWGGKNSDQLHGGPGDDVLKGGPGDDLLNGALGDDEIHGNKGNDVVVQGAHPTYTSTGAPLLVPDIGTATTTIDVPDPATSNHDVEVSIFLDHPATEHLRITLIAPNGNRTPLSAFRGNGTPFMGTQFDSEAFTHIRTKSNRDFAGRFHPEGSMELVNVRDVGGTWHLEIYDDTSGSVGRLNKWSLQFMYAMPDDDGSDSLSGGDGNYDLLTYAPRTARVSVTSDGFANDGQDGEGDDVERDFEALYGGEGNDLLRGTGANDEIRGLRGHDQLRGGQGRDELHGGDGRDTLHPGAHPDILDGGAGIDTVAYGHNKTGMTINVTAGSATDGMISTDDDDLVNVENATGGSGPDLVYGDGRNNVLRGAAGDDYLDGGGGWDILDGGPGDDACAHGESVSNC